MQADNIKQILADVDYQGTESEKKAQLNKIAAIIGKVSDVEAKNVVDKFDDPEQQDGLMRFLYFAMNHKPEMSMKTLKWHAALVNKAGLGCIVRVLTSKERL